ncbi:MAG TPA: LuxR C-terminal-related transcriptional regulator [Anaerolineae bacterium]|nr:LuxR C-terminal-related transcriptional regulator [Anaerolineae bacterium]
MDEVLLTSKLRIPPPPRTAVDRARLVRALDRAVSQARLILISAPAGYGKTTLVSQWAHAGRWPVGWVSLGEADDDLGRFLRYLFAAWQEVQPGVGDSRLGLLLSAPSPDVESVLAAFINVAHGVTGDAPADVPGDAVLVLDDYHLTADPAINDALAFLLDHLPPLLHFVVLSREEPALPLARYRARGELAEFRAADLAFGVEETKVFLNEAMGLDLADDQVAALHAQVEGWIAGLQLAALARQQGLVGIDGRAVTGRQRFIADFLRQDVLARLEDGVRQFLLETGILQHLSGALCDAVTGRSDGQEMLERLERENLFLVPLDDTRTWFRYHRLFADLLRAEMYRRDAERAAELHRRAADWYLAHDLPEEAFGHAVAADDPKLVMDILERYFSAKLLAGEIRVVQRWLDALPEEWQARYPTVGLVHAGVLLSTGQFETSTRTLDAVEQALIPGEGGEVGRQRARVTALRCYIACFQNDLARAEALADRALQALPEEDVAFRPGVYGALGDTYRRHARWEEARACYLKLLDFGHTPVFRVEAVHVYGALADLALRQGGLREAHRYWRWALEAIEERESVGRLPLPVAGWVHARVAEILYEWDGRAEARDHLSRGLRRAEPGGDVRALIAGYLGTARLELADGNVDAAAEYVERAHPLVDRAQFAHWAGRFERTRLELWLAQGRLRQAGRWADEVLRVGAGAEPERVVTRLAVARALIAAGNGRSVERAMALLRRLVQAAEGEGRTGVQIEGLALQALAHWRRGEEAAAATALEPALRLAEPEGYVRLFVDLGLPMARLLQEAHSREVMREYVEGLLAAFEGSVAVAAHPGHGLPEPLTAREQEILNLLAAGLTNREIADSLVISPGTVKKHAGNIYGKLCVHSRTEAASRARELNLLDQVVPVAGRKIPHLNTPFGA